MNWTSGKWADVAIGDDVLGADGYAWSVTDGAINYFGPSGEGESLRVTMARPIIGGTDAERDMVRTGDVFADKPVKYRASEAGGRYLLSCVGCLRTDLDGACKLHAPDPVPITVTRLGPPLTVIVDADDLALGEAGRRFLMREPAPYVEYDDAERAAAAALKGAGLQMTVIERQMTLDGLTEHIGNVHGEPLPGAGGNLTRIELRSRLADLHFQLHEHEQPRGKRWEPRGSTAHVHPVMDRPTGDPEPTSFRAKL